MMEFHAPEIKRPNFGLYIVIARPAERVVAFNPDTLNVQTKTTLKICIYMFFEMPRGACNYSHKGRKGGPRQFLSHRGQ